MQQKYVGTNKVVKGEKQKGGERVETNYNDIVDNAKKAIIQILADNGFSIQEAEEVLEVIKYTCSSQAFL